MHKPLLALVFFSCFASVLARADDTLPDPSAELRLIESTERNEDPLGLDDSTGKGLDEAARKVEAEHNKPVLPSVSRGEVLASIERVTESTHEVQVSLEQGLAFVSIKARFTSESPHRADIAYRLALPEGAVVTAVEACKSSRCESAYPQGAPKPNEPPQGAFARAQTIHDGRGPALSLLLSSVVRGEPYDLHVSYVADAPVRGGRARFTLPARGRDPHIAPSRVQVSEKYQGELEPKGPLEVDAFFPVSMQVTLQGAKPRRATTTAACGRSRCERRFEASAAGTLSERPLWLFLDASPSMEGPARARLETALAALLEALPESHEIRAFAFAARARELGSYRAATAPLSMLSDALLGDLGPGTKPSSLLTIAGGEALKAHPKLVILSDGRFDPSAREQHALDALARRGSELWLVSVGERAPVRVAPFVASGGGVVHLPELCDRSLRSGDLTPLSEALRVLASQAGPGGVRAGEEHVLEKTPAKAPALTEKPHWLALWAARDATPPTWLTPNTSRDQSAISVSPYQHVPPPPPPVDTGMPAQSVLNMLRTQLLPKARACLRSDRKGRGDYAVQVTFHALFAEREIADVRIEGEIKEPLRNCLEGVLSELRVPAFSGRIRVRYPIHTEREPEAPVIQLEPDVAEQVERVIHAPEHSKRP
jgi:hypothetical protein